MILRSCTIKQIQEEKKCILYLYKDYKRLYNMHQHTIKVHTHQHVCTLPFLYTFFCGLKIQTHTLKKKIQFMALLKISGVLPLALTHPGFPL